MKIAILAVGSRGDVEPYVALGMRLRHHGHAVRLAALEAFREMAGPSGLEFASLGELPSGFRRGGATKSAPGSARFAGLPGRILFWSIFPRLLAPRMPAFLEACAGTDLIVHSRLAVPAPHVAERLGVPCIAAYPVPHTATREFANPLYVRDGGESPAWRAASYWMEWSLTHQLSFGTLNRFRARIGLRPLRRGALGGWLAERTRAYLYGFSEAVLPRPRDWPDNAHVTGYWFRDSQADWPAPEALARFLGAGPPPLAIGFGSMLPRDSDAVTRVLLEALERTRQRAVLLSGWARIGGGASERLLTIEHAPHSWLFPRSAAAIHHGGAGTCAAAIRAGIPSVVVPFAFDQPFWARRLRDLGLAPPPIPIRELSAQTLADAIDAVVHDPVLKARAVQVGERLGQEDGVSRAVELIQAYAAGRADADGGLGLGL